MKNHYHYQDVHPPHARASVAVVWQRGVQQQDEQWQSEEDDNDHNADDNADDAEDEDDRLIRSGPESSLMFDYIRQFLDKTDTENNDDDEKKKKKKHEESPTDDDNKQAAAAAAATTASHLIAIPVDTCHELSLELESVQRAILYHCPVLVHACIAAAVTRLPLLHVTTTSTTHSSTMDTEGLEASVILQQIVQQTVQEFLQVDATAEQQQQEADDDDDRPRRTAASLLDNVARGDDSTSTNDDDDNAVAKEDEDLTTPNADGIQPWLVPFGGLGVDGPDHDVLYTAAVPNAVGTTRLQAFGTALQQRIALQTGWSAEWVHTTSAAALDDENNKEPQPQPQPHFRIPFMRLPGDWQDIIRREYQLAKKNESDGSNGDNDDAASNNNKDNDDDNDLFLTSDQGGNGISPIFWAQWMDDPFGQGDTRLREVAIYRRRRSTTTGSSDDQRRRRYLNDNPEWAFYLPERTVPLPAGNAALSKVEAEFQEYQEQRWMDAEQALEAEQSGNKEQSSGAGAGAVAKEQQAPEQPDDDLLLAKTRERLEAVYSQQAQEFQTKITPQEEEKDTDIKNASTTDGSSKATEDNDNTIGDDDDDDDDFDWRSGTTERPEDPSALDDWTRQRIQEAVASRARVQSQKELARKKDKPPIAENPVFQKYKDGTLVPKPEQSEQKQQQEELPPFPSREHCTGFWRVVRSPTGFAVEEGSDEDPSRSDNLILRVDGTTAGGPILDQETRQKASGGTWRLLTTTTGEDDNVVEPQAQLRIRLVIPPKKERILVMQGRLEKVSLSAPSGDLPLASSTFQIPAVEERAARAAAAAAATNTMEMEDLLYCSGTVWIEDAVTARNRDEIGKFSLMKLNIPMADPSQFTVTIPRPIRNQD